MQRHYYYSQMLHFVAAFQLSAMSETANTMAINTMAINTMAINRTCPGTYL